MKKLQYLLAFALAFAFNTSNAQNRHEGELNGTLKVGTHTWYYENGKKEAEVVYDANGMLQSFRTWTDKGQLMEEEGIFYSKAERVTFPAFVWEMRPSGLGVWKEEAMEGTGSMPAEGSKVGVYYAGYLQDGTLFDQNYDGKVFKFKHLKGEVIQGFDEAISTMKVGETTWFYIPSAIGYNNMVAGIIPPYSDLVYKITLVEVK